MNMPLPNPDTSSETLRPRRARRWVAPFVAGGLALGGATATTACTSEDHPVPERTSTPSATSTPSPTASAVEKLVPACFIDPKRVPGTSGEYDFDVSIRNGFVRGEYQVTSLDYVFDDGKTADNIPTFDRVHHTYIVNGTFVVRVTMDLDVAPGVKPPDPEDITCTAPPLVVTGR